MFLTGCANWFLVHPTTDQRGSSGERRLLDTKVGRIAVYEHERRGTCSRRRPVVLEFIGNASRAEYGPMVPRNAWCRAPAFVWRVNYPGFGDSEGDGTLDEIAEAALAAYDVLADEVDCPIVVAGNSLGSTAALWVGRSRPVAGVVVKNPPALKHVILRDFGWWNLWIAASIVAIQIPPKLDSVSNARRISAPVLMITSGNDGLVSPGSQDLIFDAIFGPRWRVVIPNAGHNAGLTAQTPGLRAGLRWLQRCPR